MAKEKKSSLSSRLKALQKTWKKTEPRKVGAPLAPGDYTARIDTATIGESKSGRIQIDWALTIVGDEYDGKKVHRYTGLETEENLGFLQGDLEVLGLTIPDDIDDLGDTLTEANGMMVEITVVKNDEFLNIYFNDVVDGDDEEKEKDEEPEEDDEIEWEVGDRVVVEIDEEDYAGEITKVKKNKATVEFDDDDVLDVDLDELSPEEDD